MDLPHLVHTTPPLEICFQACAPILVSTAVAKTVCLVCLAFLGSWGGGALSDDKLYPLR